MTETGELMTRREALARAGYLLGGALSASTVAGVLAGCSARSIAGATGRVPRTFSPRQSEMVAVMSELVIPRTDTPGAREARVHEYIDVMLTDYYPAADRARFLEGLERADARARSMYGRPFLETSPAQQLELVRALSQQAYRDPPRDPLPPADPALHEGKTPSENDRTRPVAETPWAAEDVGRGAFFRTLKELVLVGYYTSEAGAQELRVNPMGVWLPDVPYSQIGRSWA